MYQTKSIGFSSTAVTAIAVSVAVVALIVPRAFAFADDGDFSPDFGSSDYSGFDTSDVTSYDTYTPDTTAPDTTTNYDTYTPDWTDSTYNYDTYTPDTTDNTAAGDQYDTYDVYSENSTDCGCTEQNGVDYTEQTYTTPSQTSYSTPSYSTSSSAPFSVSVPGYAPSPIIQNIPVVYQQQQQQQQQIASAPPVTYNTCTNYSCNTTTSISNSGNTTTTIIPIASAPITYPVQYTFPQQPVYNYQNNYQNVSCSITAYPSSISAGQYTYLSWQSYGATSATLANYGNVAPNGSLSVHPYGSTNYVLTVYGYNGQTATCNTFISVVNNVPSVTLSQIPYTGFDLGTFGDAMYWAMLALFALAAGYLLVYFKGGVGSFAMATIPTRKTQKVSVVTSQTKVAPTPIVKRKIETPAPIAPATIDTLPAFANVRPTSDSMQITHEGGAPRIVISRN